MANRHLSRSVAIQALFEWDFNDNGKKSINEILDRDILEFAPGIDDASFARKLSLGVVKEKEKLDKIIEKAAPEWPIDQISVIDRNILRLGLYELLFGNRKEVPPKVAINEAIELAKAFGGDSSSRFVNGVLGTVYKELGEPQKGDTKKNDNSQINSNNLPEDMLAGAVVYRREGGRIIFAFVHDVFGFWTLSKGRVEKGEDLMVGAKREIKEEMGLDMDIENELGENSYIASDPERGKVKKRVFYFLGQAKQKELKRSDSGGLDGVDWFEAREVANLKMYDDIRPIIIKAVKILSNKSVAV
ncbi:MAG: transcription antitermination factor NusB [Parcubacteria group bacterium]|nr:transcription antitermination factor NusB [Parcubacteria group bacterium]MCR4342383.1 transcription antitermination factor NusB [Patescibacteria group bacterium]